METIARHDTPELEPFSQDASPHDVVEKVVAPLLQMQTSTAIASSSSVCSTCHANGRLHCIHESVEAKEAEGGPLFPNRNKYSSDLGRRLVDFLAQEPVPEESKDERGDGDDEPLPDIDTSLDDGASVPEV